MGAYAGTRWIPYQNTGNLNKIYKESERNISEKRQRKCSQIQDAYNGHPRDLRNWSRLLTGSLKILNGHGCGLMISHCTSTHCGHLERVKDTKWPRLSTNGSFVQLYISLQWWLIPFQTIKYRIKWHGLVSVRGSPFNTGKNNKERQT